MEGRRPISFPTTSNCRPRFGPMAIKFALTRSKRFSGLQRRSHGGGLSESLMPVVKVLVEGATPATYNDPALTRRVREALTRRFGSKRIHRMDPRWVARILANSGARPKGCRSACSGSERPRRSGWPRAGGRGFRFPASIPAVCTRPRPHHSDRGHGHDKRGAGSPPP